jgi:hypothetical protein
MHARFCRGSKIGKMTFLFLLALLVSTSAAPATSHASFEALYDYYFPKTSPYLPGDYRRGLDSLLSAVPKAGEDRHHFYDAFHGDATAFNRFVHHPDRRGVGEFTLTWIKESLVLLLKLGDTRFAALLRQQDPATREIVGAAIEQQIDWTVHDFPRTRRLYSYRYISPQKENQKRAIR